MHAIQVAARDIDAEAAVREYATGGRNTVHGQGDDVTGLEGAGHVAGNRNVTAGFYRVDDVVGGDVGIEGDGCDRGGIDTVSLGIGDRGGRVLFKGKGYRGDPWI